MDLYKIKYDIRRPDIDQLTINKDSKFAIKLELPKPNEDSSVNAAPIDGYYNGEYPILIVKKADGTTDYLRTDRHADIIWDSEEPYYVWQINSFNQNISCYVNLYQYYYDEETEKEWENESIRLICRVDAKEASIAENAIAPIPYENADSILFGRDSEAGQFSVTIGTENQGNGNSTVTIGVSNINNYSDSNIIGNSNTSYTTMNNTFGFANTTHPNSKYSTTIGTWNSLEGKNSLAIGNNLSVDALSSIAIGNKTSVNSDDSIAIGNNAKIENNLSGRIQLGTGTIKENSTTILQVNEFPLLNRFGKIPLERIPSDAIGGEDNPVYGLYFRDINDNEKLWWVGIENGQLIISEH